jgi:hypothetical protein
VKAEEKEGKENNISNAGRIRIRKSFPKRAYQTPLENNS